MSSRKAVCLLSGGLDSSTCLALARRDGFECYALSFDYGQRHRIELEAAARVAAFFGAREHRTARIDLRAFGASALTADIDVPKHRSADEMAQGIPITYVPARNTIFLSFALAWAEVLECSDIFIGVNAHRLLGLSGLPAGVHRGLRAHGEPGDQGRRRRTHADADSHAADRAEQGRDRAPGAPNWASTSRSRIAVTIPIAEGRPCGQCDSCLLRREGLRGGGRSRTRWCTRHENLRDLLFHSRRGHAGRRPQRVRAHQRLQSALHLVRHAVHVVEARRRRSCRWTHSGRCAAAAGRRMWSSPAASR